MSVTFNEAPQGSDEWLQARKGLVTGSKFKYARDKLKSGKPSGKCILYAQDTARERLGGTAASVYVNAAMRFGQEQESEACRAYETMTGHFVTAVGFATSDCKTFGLSPDGLVDKDGVIEIKTIVGSDNLFTAVVDEDFSEYMDQCLGYLLFLDRQWVDLILWAPDLEQVGLGLSIHRISRCDHEADIAALKVDLDAFAKMVREFEAKLRSKAAANIDQLKAVA